MFHASRVRVICSAAVAFVAAACLHVPPPSAAVVEDACCLQQGLAIASRHRVSAIAQRRFTQQELWSALSLVLRAPALRVTDVGQSIQGRPIRAVTFGTGPTTVLLWSQMHGDESTATMSLA